MSRQALGEIKIIGELTYFKSSESENSSIHDGTFRSKLKIKVRTVEDNKVNKIEVERFLKLKAHPNVQRLFCYEFYESIHHFGLQTYDFNLYDFMQISKNKRIKIDPISMVKDVTEGLKFLHTNEIIHGNLNFKNVGINKAAKRTMLCYCGFDDLQEDQNIFIAPEEVPGDNSSFKVDIFNLGCIIYFILSNGNHPFGSLKNSRDIIKNIKEKEFNREYKDFKNLITEKGVKSNYKIECAISLLKLIFKKNPTHRPDCTDILEHPLFWSNFQMYNFLMELNVSWRSLTEDETRLIDSKGSKYFNIHTWTYQLNSVLKGTIYNIEERKSLVELVKFVASKVKHYEDELTDNILTSEHLLYYLKQFPFLLPLIYNLNEILKEKNKKFKAVNYVASHSQNSIDKTLEICNPEYSQKEGGLQSISEDYNKNLKTLIFNNDLPTSLLISPNAVQTTSFLNKSNSEIYCGTFSDKIVAIKKIVKENFIINEIKSINKLITRGKTAMTTRKNKIKSKCCEKDECENIIKFYGCFEEPKFYCLVLEKAEMDFKTFVKSVRNDVDSDDKIVQILLDIVNGLECIHKNNVAHLDITPRNILIVTRNDRLVGCLADFGESVEGIKKTYTRSKIRGTDGYIAPELEKVARQRESNKRKRRSTLNNTETTKDASIDCSKCDIYSLGMVIIKDCIGLEITHKTSTTRSLKNLRQRGKITFSCEELANSMTEIEATKRPNAECVRKNPFFWKGPDKKIDFLKTVNKFRNRHETDQKRIQNIEADAVKNLPKNDWIEFFDDFKDIQTEILKHLHDNNKSSKSIFDLVELILLIVTPESTKSLPVMRQKFLNLQNFQSFFNYFFKSFDIITYLYYVMLDDLKYSCREFYSSDTPKRLMSIRRITVDEKPNKKRKLSIASDTASEMSYSGSFKVPKVPKMS